LLLYYGSQDKEGTVNSDQNPYRPFLWRKFIYSVVIVFVFVYLAGTIWMSTKQGAATTGSTRRLEFVTFFKVIVFLHLLFLKRKFILL
jgi:biotin transporter BioY